MIEFIAPFFGIIFGPYSISFFKWIKESDFRHYIIYFLKLTLDFLALFVRNIVFLIKIY